MTIDPAFYSPVPPVFVGNPYSYTLAVFSLLLVSLLALEWGWRVAWSMVEQPESFKAPATCIRLTALLLMISILIRVGPDVILYGSWRDLSPAGRYWWALADKRLDFVSFAPFSLAWLLSFLGTPMVSYQLRRQPIPLHLWPTWRQMQRPLKIGIGVMALAIALTTVR